MSDTATVVIHIIIVITPTVLPVSNVVGRLKVIQVQNVSQGAVV